jgi:hypothetical protein
MFVTLIGVAVPAAEWGEVFHFHPAHLSKAFLWQSKGSSLAVFHTYFFIRLWFHTWHGMNE